MYFILPSVDRIRSIKNTDHILIFITSCKAHGELRHMIVNTTHTLFEDTETVSKRGDQRVSSSHLLMMSAPSFSQENTKIKT